MQTLAPNSAMDKSGLSAPEARLIYTSLMVQPSSASMSSFALLVSAGVGRRSTLLSSCQ
jgi:hypothetical protein